MMLLTTKISFRFLWRLAAIAIVCLGGCLYCLYDGAIGYPKQREAAVVYQQLKDKGLDSGEFFEQWDKVAKERGWSTKKPKDDLDILKQYVMAGCLVVPGLLYVFLFFRSWKRWIELNETGLRTSWGQTLTFDQIVALDKKKWKKKGIAVIRYQRDGRSRRLALDDWKYDAKTTKEVLIEVESRIDPTQIVGGLPEPPPESPLQQDEPQERSPE
jgi:hypothetical protein